MQNNRHITRTARQLQSRRIESKGMNSASYIHVIVHAVHTTKQNRKALL